MRILFTTCAVALLSCSAFADAPEGRLLVERVPARTAPAPLARAADATATPWVRRQQPVVAEARVANVLVESPALALADGREGDMVQVRLASSGPIRQGRVVAPGRVAL